MASPRRLPLLAGALSLALFCECPVGAAQDASVRDTAAARVLFQEGVACADRRDWTCAADRFERAHTLRASPVIAYNLGHALVEAGRLVEGSEILRRLLREEGTPRNVRADAERVIDGAEPRIAWLHLTLSGPRDGVTITIDARELPSSLVDTPAPVDPGARAIEAWRDGAVIASTQVSLAEGASERIELAIPALPEAPVAVVPTPVEVARDAVVVPAPAESSDEGTWIALGVTGGLLVVAGAVVLGVVLATPQGEERPFEGNLGRVEIGR